MFSLNVCEHKPGIKNIKINALFNVLGFTLYNLPRTKTGSQYIGILWRTVDFYLIFVHIETKW